MAKTCWAIATHTRSVNNGRDILPNEPEIGHGIYGKMKSLHPIFMEKEEAIAYANELNVDCNVVEMDLK